VWCIKEGTELGFEMADEQALLEKPIEVKGLPDVIQMDAYESTVFKKSKDDFLGMIMSRLIRGCMSDILEREVRVITDEMLKFWKVIGDRMSEIESLDKAGAVRLENFKRSFKAGWRMWRTALENREDKAYNVFISVMKAEEKPEEEKED